MRDDNKDLKKKKMGIYLFFAFLSGIILILFGFYLGSINKFGYVLGTIGAIITIASTIIGAVTFPIRPIP